MPVAPTLADRDTFLDAVRAAGILTPQQQTKAQAVAPCGSATDAAGALMHAGLLTRFQVERLLAGYTDGFHLGQYVILDQLGRGTLSRVYKAKHRTMHRAVAIKVLSSELTRTSEDREELRREVQTAGKLSHPNIVTVFDANERHDRFYLVLELVDGPNLGALVLQRGPLPIDEACEIVRQIAHGLNHAHEQGTIHGALKPSNILVARPTASAPVSVKIADFALPRFGPTSEYAAPEQAQGAATVRADLYALGGIFSFLLTGHPPGDGGQLEQLRPDVPSAVAAIVARLLSRAPATRFGSTSELLEHLGLACIPVAIPMESVSFEMPPSAEPYTPDGGYLTGRHALPDGSGAHAMPSSGTFAVPQAPSPWEQLTDETASQTTPLELDDDTPSPLPHKAPRLKPAARGHGGAVPLWMLATLLTSAVLLTGMGIFAVVKLLAK